MEIKRSLKLSLQDTFAPSRMLDQSKPQCASYIAPDTSWTQPPPPDLKDRGVIGWVSLRAGHVDIYLKILRAA
jgi:hypothetical protein